MVGLISGLPQITQRYLNTASYAGDPSPGTVVQTSDVSGSVVQPYSGILGQIVPLGKAAADYVSDKVNGQQLYPGNFQYVRVDPNATASALVQGQVVYWLDNTTNLLPGGDFLVSPDETAAELGLIAGIALANTAKGKYWWIQVSGIAQVKFNATIGAATPAVGDLVFADYSNPSNLAYVPTQTTNNLTLAQLKAVLGIAWGTAPAANTISPVMLGGLCNPKYVPGGSGGEG